tara:strand:+ start:318 stop:458 length:141 start_codon:yes stop_codon:yes gene_type:complete
MKNDFDERYIQKRQKTRQKQAKIGKKNKISDIFILFMFKKKSLRKQ